MSSRISQITIIVVGYYGDKWLPACLESLAALKLSNVSICVVDNYGNSCFEQLPEYSPTVTALKIQGPKGFAEANNIALTKIKSLGEFVAFVNQDTISTQDWITPCLECLNQFPDVAAVTPVCRDYENNDWEPRFLEIAIKSEKLSCDLESGIRHAGFYEMLEIPATAMVVRKNALLDVGPFDPIFESYYEDIDLCQRLRKAGYRVGVCTGGAIRHHEGSATNSAAAERKRARWITRNRVIVSQRQAKSARFSSLLRHFLFAFPRGVARSVMGRAGAKPLGAFLKAHWDLLKLFPRLVSENKDQSAWQQYLEEIGWYRLSEPGLNRAHSK